MYKIYINETPLLLLNTAELDKIPDYQGEILKANYRGKPKFLLHYIDLLEKSDRFAAICLHAKDEKQLFEDFQTLYKKIKAAGGLVFNEKNEALVMFRRGFWDLPKGKMDPGESEKETAVREVQEETGLQQLDLGRKITETYHTYRLPSGKRVLKKTYWFLMHTREKDLHPQTEEDIEIAIWRSLPAFLAEKPVIYKNILEVIEKGTQ